MFLGAGPPIFENARRNRFRPTAAEDVLWNYLRGKPGGCKFRRQHPLGQYIADFYCHALRLVVEIDGSVHDSPEAQVADANRQHWLESQGLTVIRFRNGQVLKTMDAVKASIESYFPKQ